jgi:hypothetical protein
MEVNGVLDGSGDMVPGRMVLEGTDLDIAQRHPSGSALHGQGKLVLRAYDPEAQAASEGVEKNTG